MRTLIVDDDYGTRHLLLVNLSPLGQCSIAKGGVEGIYKFQEALETKLPYRLICMDINMPMMDGTQALEKIREIEQHHHIKPEDRCKVLMITGDDDPKNILKSMKLQADKYIKKPIRKAKLIAVLKALDLI